MKIECSRQLCAERTDRRTDRHTDKVTPWAPSRSQKSQRVIELPPKTKYSTKKGCVRVFVIPDIT